MSRPVTDIRSIEADQGARKQGVSWRPLSLEVQLWIVVSLLIAFGLVMIYSASSVMPLKDLSGKVQYFKSSAHYLNRQAISIVLGLVVILFVSRIPYRDYKQHIGWMLLAVILSLVLVLLPSIGVESNNARRWFRIGPFLLQPAEYAKVVWVIYLSVSLFKKQEKIKQLSIGFWPHIILCGVLSALLLREPDFGTTFMIACLTVFMLIVGGVPCRTLFLLVPVAFLGFYKFVYHVPYRWERVTAFLNPWIDPLDSGYQLIQAWIAVGSGGLWGKGLGAGQQKLFYLPEAHTDFILAVVGEELGFVGIVIVCVLFFFLFRTAIEISRQAPDLLGTFLAFGLTMMLSFQALLNMGVVLGLVPTKGLPLPFISYGGSAFTANCMAVGILMNIARSSERRME
jgi:cell division protein FtsW